MSQTQDTIVAALMEQLIAEGSEGMAQVFTALFNLAMRLERERWKQENHTLVRFADRLLQLRGG